MLPGIGAGVSHVRGKVHSPSEETAIVGNNSKSMLDDPKGHPGVKVFLVAMVLPGNSYPATEHPFVVPFVQDASIVGDDKRKPNPVGLLGQACKGGYQSHYSVIDTKSFAAPFPTQFDDFEDHEKKRVVSDELVVFEGAQALPLFLVYYKTTSSKIVAGNPTEVAAGVVSPGGDVEVVRKEMFSGGSSPPSSVQGKFSSLILVCSS